LAENNESATPSKEDLQSWAEEYAVTHPLVADENWAVSNRFEADGGIPTLSLLKPGAEVVIADGRVSESDIEAALPE
jgi:hypothetical protein